MSVFASMVLVAVVFLPLAGLLWWWAARGPECDGLIALLSMALYVLAAFLLLDSLGSNLPEEGGFGEGLATMPVFGLLVVVSFAYCPLFSGYLAGLISGQFWMSQPTHVQPTYDQAEAAEKMGDVARAMMLLEAGVLQNPKDPYPWVRLADLRCKQGQFCEAVDALRQARDRETDPQCWADRTFRMADLLVEKLGQPQEAILSLREVLGRFPKRPCAVQAKGRIRHLSQRRSEGEGTMR